MRPGLVLYWTGLVWLSSIKLDPLVSESAELRAPIPNSGNYATSMIRVFRSVTKPEQELDWKRGRGADNLLVLSSCDSLRDDSV
jgi:hypothetical protein